MPKTNPCVIYHNPRCSNSRGALQLLHEAEIEPRLVEYLNAPLTAAQVLELMAAYEGSPSDFVRFKEAEAATMGVNPEISREDLAAAVESAPVLLQRPIVRFGDRVIIARPPEKLRPHLERVTPESSPGASHG